MKVGFIGAGKVGFSLGKYLSINNIELSGYYSNNYESAVKASEFTGSIAYIEIAKLISDSDIIIITTPDEAIEEIWSKMVSININNKIICHCSGLLSSKIFSNISNHGACGYSIHPIYAFSDKYNSYKNLNQALITIEGKNEKINVLVDLFSNIGNEVKIISAKDKSKYHVASVFVSNHVIGLCSIGTKLLSQCGFSEDEAFDSLCPLIVNNINNLVQKGIKESLTGPIERGDIATVEAHIDCLENNELSIYKLLSKELISISKKKNNKNYEKLEKIMEG